MKRLFILLITTLLMVGCGSNSQGSGSNTINLYTRDASSGTREAFESVVGIENLSTNAVETSGNGDMATKVGQDSNAIGYVSLSTDMEGNNLKPISFEGVEATTDNVLNGSYTLARPFSYTTRASGDFDSMNKEKVVNAFIDFLTNSIEGLSAVESQHGIVDITKGKPWAELAANHPILNENLSDVTLMTGGSTSVEKTLKAALESFQAQTGIGFTMNHTGSGDGYKRTLGTEKDGANYADIGFTSRTFKSEEDVSSALITGKYADDAVVVVVSNNHLGQLDNLTASSIKDIFEGTITSYDDIK